MMMGNRGKIALFVGSDITAHLVLNQIVPEFIKHGYTPVIYLPKHKSNERAQLPELKQAAFLERVLNNNVVYPFIDSNPLDSETKNLSPTGLARKYGLHIEHVEDVNSPSFVQGLKDDKAIVGGLSVRCFQIFKEEIIEALKSREFFLNLHPGILPDYRGVMSTAWAMATGSQKYGWTLHEVDKGIDTGRILWLTARKFELPKTVVAANIEIANMGAESIRNALEKMRNGEVLTGYPQGKETATYYTYPKPEELSDWGQKGIVLADPTETARLLVQHFSDPNTRHGVDLKRAITRAISSFNSSPTPLNMVKRSLQSPDRTAGHRHLAAE